MYCKHCGSENNDNSLFCTECGEKFNSVANINYEHQYNNTSSPIHRKRNSVGIAIVIIAAIVIPTSIFLYTKYSSENQKALYLYNIAYDSLYNTDITYISNKTKTLINKAVNQADSPFVSASIKQDIAALQDEGNDYTLLSEIEDILINEKDNIEEVTEKMRYITSDTVKNDERYTSILPYVKSLEFKQSQKAWAENKLEELKTEHASSIDSWSRTHYILYYIGSISLSEAYSPDGDGFAVTLEDYSGYTRTLWLWYNNLDVSDTWNSNLSELKNHLINKDNCIIAAITADDGISEQIFSYSYKIEQ